MFFENGALVCQGHGSYKYVLDFSFVGSRRTGLKRTSLRHLTPSQRDGIEFVFRDPESFLESLSSLKLQSDFEE